MKERALTVNAGHFKRVKRYAEAPPPEPYWPDKEMLRLVDEVLHRPGILRRNSGGHATGYYGGRNAAWFAELVLPRLGALPGWMRDLKREPGEAIK